jgi:hypothetical protein
MGVVLYIDNKVAASLYFYRLPPISALQVYCMEELDHVITPNDGCAKDPYFPSYFPSIFHDHLPSNSIHLHRIALL